jgi:hypothetical protein
MTGPRLIVLAAAVLVIGALTLALCRDREPRYQGRTLTDWENEFRHTHHGIWPNHINDPQAEPSLIAIRQIGTNAFPFLLRELAARDTPLRKRIASFVNRYHLTSKRMEPATLRQLHAISILRLIADRAQPMVPDLIKLTTNPDSGIRNIALMALMVIRPDRQTMLPVLRRLIHDPDESVHQNAEMDLADISPEEAEALGISKSVRELWDTLHNGTNTNGPILIK